MLTEGGTICGPQSMDSLHPLMHRLTPSEQLATCDALVDLAVDEIVSQMTPENIVEEMFRDSPAWVHFLVPVQQVADRIKTGQQKSSIGGRKSSGRIVKVSISVPSCREYLRRLLLGTVLRMPLHSLHVSLSFFEPLLSVARCQMSFGWGIPTLYDLRIYQRE